MSSAIKGMFIILAIIYIISPLDAAPGPIDDVIVALVGLAALKTKIGIE